MPPLIDWRGAPLLAALAACSPALDWREVRVDGDALVAQFPCRPDRRIREVPVAGHRVRMEMTACSAEGNTFAASHFAVDEPANVSAAIEALKAAAVANVGGASAQSTPFELRGMTPNPAAARLSVSGRLPGGEAVRLSSVFFSRGLRVYQLNVLGPASSASAADTFFAGTSFKR
jgi:hypothetical protein